MTLTFYPMTLKMYILLEHHTSTLCFKFHVPILFPLIVIQFLDFFHVLAPVTLTFLPMTLKMYTLLDILKKTM